MWNRSDKHHGKGKNVWLKTIFEDYHKHRVSGMANMLVWTTTHAPSLKETGSNRTHCLFTYVPTGYPFWKTYLPIPSISYQDTTLSTKRKIWKIYCKKKEPKNPTLILYQNSVGLRKKTLHNHFKETKQKEKFDSGRSVGYGHTTKN